MKVTVNNTSYKDIKDLSIPKLNRGATIMHTDATSVLNVGMNLEDLEKAMTVNIGKVTWYFEVNSLYTNFLKSNFILFQTNKVKLSQT
jgi:hypothetical protein